MKSTKSISNEQNFKKTLVEVGKQLKNLRIKKGYRNRIDFITAYQLPPIQYWRMENGTANLTFKSLSKILAIHELNIEEFFEMHINNSQTNSRKAEG